MIYIKTKKQLKKMRKAGNLAARVLEETGKQVRPGISTLELNNFANEMTKRAGAVSAPYRYKASTDDPPFPKHVCTSVNNVVCHGIPRKDEILKDGDIINIDITVIFKGYHGDTSRTFLVGDVNEEAEKLVNVTEQAMYAGISSVKPYGCLTSIGSAIEEFVSPHGYSIVDKLCGHGLGEHFHEEPSVFHFKNTNKLQLLPGMTMTCEPMVSQGSKEVRLLGDGWTIITADGKLSAQWEHSFAVLENGVEILTQL